METPQQPVNVPPPAPVQIIPPLSRAWDHMKAQLFPFDLRRWITLGFVSWLSALSLASCRVSWPQFPKQNQQAFAPQEIWPHVDKVLQFVDANMNLIILFGATGFVFATAILVVVIYLRTRGLFMYMDCIVRRTAEVGEPWRRAGRHTRPLFLLRLAAGLVLWLAFLGVAAFLVEALLPALRSHTFDLEQAFPILLAGLALTPLFLAWALVAYIATELLAPIMYLRGMGLAQAWRELRRLVDGNFWSFVLFGLMQMVLGWAYGMLTVPVVCCTCCVGGLPVINQTITQPMLLLMRAYPLYFLAQFGPEYAMTLWPGPERVDPGAVRATVAACTHCGQRHQIPGGVQGQYLCTRCGRQFEVS